MKRVALVTGSTSGIGLAIAQRLAQEGIIVALHSKSSAEIGKVLRDKLPGSTYTQADLSNEFDAKRLIADVLQQHGQLDILVNNAGVSQTIAHADLKAATSAIWQNLYAVNVIAPWVLIGEAEQALRSATQRGSAGCIVNISSHAGVRPKGASIPYAVSKSALNHMTKLLSVTLAPEVRVNAIAPGLMTQSWHVAQELWRTQSPMKRAAQPDDIADLVMMVAVSSYLTGQVIIVDGGLHLT